MKYGRWKRRKEEKECGGENGVRMQRVVAKNNGSGKGFGKGQMC